jgi:HAD superfamily hydrolase (TIGR01509 family)
MFIEGREIKGAAFDLEGTFVNLEPFHWQAHKDVAKILGINLDLNLSDINDQKNTEVFMLIPGFIGSPREVIVSELLSLAESKGLWTPASSNPSFEREAKIKELSNIDGQIYRKLLDDLKPGDIQPREGAVAFAKELKSRGIPIAIGSLTKNSEARRILELTDLNNLFDTNNIVLKGDVTRVKPDPEVYFKTAEKMGISPTEQVVFEDSHRGIEAAVAAGSLPIGIPVINQPEITLRLLDSGARKVFLNWSLVRESILPQTKEGGKKRKES